MSSFLNKVIPKSLWKSNVIHIPSQLIEAHKKFLKENNWMAEYDPHQQGMVGGNDEDDAKKHLINRFFNSVVRMGYVCIDPKGEDKAIREMVLDQFADGQLYILDIASGNGAGTLAILSYLSSLREERNIPKLPLNLKITAVDYSSEALNYYAELIDKIRPWFEANGLSLELTLVPCDLRVVGEFGECLDSFLDEAKDNGGKRFLCTISAISGIRVEGMAAITDSLKHAATRLSSTKRSSSWLWVEPHVNKAWFKNLLDAIWLTITRQPHRLVSMKSSLEVISELEIPSKPLNPRRFSWFEPYNNKTIKSSVVVAVFKND
jgi:hypothetical protein